MSTQHVLAGIALAVLASDVSAQSDFISAVVPPFRGSNCTEFGAWDSFTIPFDGPNLPDVVGSTSSASIRQLIPGAILTSTGNIYHPSQTPAFRLDDVAAQDVQEVVLQTATLGNPRNHGSFILSFTGANQQTVVLAPTAAIILVANAPTREELYFRWDLSTYADTILAYRIDWVSSASNSSLTGVLLDVRTNCPTGVAQCFGDGSSTACPCANTGTAGNGCANSVNSSGAQLAAAGSASIGFDNLVLTGSGMPNSSCLYFQGSTAASIAFGDGLRCAAGQVIRLGTNANVAGTSHYPAAGQLSVSVRGVASAGDARIYQAWYRNAAAFCTASTFNLTNAVQISWTP